MYSLLTPKYLRFANCGLQGHPNPKPNPILMGRLGFIGFGLSGCEPTQVYLELPSFQAQVLATPIKIDLIEEAGPFDVRLIHFPN